MLTVDKLEKGDNLRPIRKDKERTAVAALKFVGWLEHGSAIVPEPPRRRDEDAERR